MTFFNDTQSFEGQQYDDYLEEFEPYEDVVDRLVTMDPIMRDLMNAACPGLGDYVEPSDTGWGQDSLDRADMRSSSPTVSGAG